MSKSQPQPWITARNPASASPAGSRSGQPPAWRRQLAATSRWLHIYLSMVSFVIVLFFALTGLTLNHADWFDDQFTTTDQTGTVPAAWVNPTDTAAINKLALVEQLRTAHGVRGAVQEFRIDPDQCAVSFQGPGYTAEATVNRHTGAYQLTETRMGLVAVLNDLHKGRDTGKAWGWVIDGSALFMTLISVTGLVLLLFLRKRRVAGLVLLGIGLVVVYALFRLSV